jgi:LacI family transcriptional regulator
MNRHPRILLDLPSQWGFSRGISRGIASYCRLRSPWHFDLSERLPGAWWEDRDLPYDGAIITASRGRLWMRLQESGLPVVNISSESSVGVFKSVLPDNRAIGRIAAEFFLDRGFSHFGFFGLPHHTAAIDRFSAFNQRLMENGFSARQCSEKLVNASWNTYLKVLGEWVSGLPKPVALFGFNDVRASDLLQACIRAGVQVPEEAAVLGVDNDPFICEIAYPPLASIDPGFQGIGFTAAELLDQLIRGKAVSPKPVEMAPRGLVLRLSADLVAVSNPHVARAVKFIRENIATPFQVKDILREVPMARRALEQGFRKELGRTIHEEILRVRVERAKVLLEGSNLPLDEVALRSGFRYQAHFNVIFKKQTGQPPGTYRRNRQVIK